MEDTHTNKTFFIDKDYDFRYWHDTIKQKPSDFIEDDYNVFFDKYKRRYNRLFNAINSGENILFITTQHFDRIYSNTNNKESLIELYNFLEGKNKNTTMYAFNYCDEDFIFNNLHHINIKFTTNVNFQEAKDNFTQNLYKTVNEILYIS
jgi:hypothetical protein